MKFSLYIFFLMLSFFFLSCREEKKENVLLTATLRGPSAMAMIHMLESPPVIGDSIETRFIIKNEPQQIRAMMMEGKTDIAVLPSTMAALLYNHNGKYLFAAIPVWGTLYLFGSDKSVKGWEDLRGKKINVIARGMTPDIMFRYLAARNGLDPDRDFQVDYSFPTHTELANAVKSGIAELGVISEPLVSLSTKANSEVRSIIDFNREWDQMHMDTIPFAQTALLVKKSLAESSPELVMEYLNEVRSSIEKVNAYPEEAARLIVSHGILPDTLVARRSIPGSHLGFSYAWDIRKGINDYFRIFYNFNPLILGNKLPDEGFYFEKTQE